MANDYIEYPLSDYRNFERMCVLPLYVARAWVEPKGDQMSWYQRGGGGPNFLMNKGAIRVHTEDDGCSLWIYKHDFKFYLLRMRGKYPERRYGLDKAFANELLDERLES